MQPNDTQPGVSPTPEPTEPVVSPTPEPSVQPEPAPVVTSTPAETPTPVASSSEPTPPVFGSAATGPDAPKKKSKLPLIIIIAVVVALLIGGGVFAYTALTGDKDTTSNNESTEGTEETATDVASKEVIARTDGTLSLSDTVEGKTEITAQNINAELNEQVNFSNGLSLMVTKVERDFTGYNAKYLKVAADEEVVAVTVVVGSRSSEGNGFSKNALTMQAPSSEKITTEFVSSLAEVDGMLDVGSGVEQGEQKSGRLLYVVKKSESPLALNYSATYRNTGSGEQVTLAAKFAL